MCGTLNIAAEHITPEQEMVLPRSELRMVWNSLRIGIDADVRTVRITVVDNVIHHHYPGCGTGKGGSVQGSSITDRVLALPPARHVGNRYDDRET